MERVSVQSRLIHSIAHNEQTEALHVWLRSGKHRVHYHVTSEEAAGLTEAFSPGRYYLDFIYAREMPVRMAAIWVPRWIAIVLTVGALAIPY